MGWAASQMTLRRHVLRNHKSRAEWGYQCPYCSGAFMEPASYQHHIMYPCLPLPLLPRLMPSTRTQHVGQSGTFGCPEVLCNFQTLCARHFRDHLRKHQTRRSYNAAAQFVEISDGIGGDGDDLEARLGGPLPSLRSLLLFPPPCPALVQL